MTRRSTLLALAAIVLALSACISHRPVRTFDDLQAKDDRPFPYCNVPVPQWIATSIAKLQATGPAGEMHRNEVSCAAQEVHDPIADNRTSLTHDGFDLHVLEFDDEGRPWNTQRVNLTFDRLREQLKDPAVVVGFVHGWKNSASVCNGNLSCFREVLEILAKAEQMLADGQRTPRRVIGIYIGWRGGTTDAAVLKEFTFWGRKHTAHVVGDNAAVTAVIERVRTIVEDARCPAAKRIRIGAGPEICQAPDPFEMTSLVWVGHSFGGALLYSALGTSINARVGAAMQVALGGPVIVFPPPARSSAPAQPVIVSENPVYVPSGGDLVVLINPAMEASRFANVNAVRNLEFQGKQVPIFMTLASEGDGPVGSFFPIGQSLATLARSARTRDVWFSMVKGFGLYEPYHTHRLVLKPTSDYPLPEERKGECRCPENLGAFGDALVTRLKTLFDALKANPPTSVDSLRLASYQEMLYTRLEPIRDVSPHNPFVMATIDTRVVSGHNDIFNPRLMDFLIEFIIRAEIKRALNGEYVRGLTP